MTVHVRECPAPHFLATRKRIGIIAGAGPEAGIDLWKKILEANKACLGDRFSGDLDAPDVTVLSVPELGLAMDLRENEEQLWCVLRDAILAMDAAGVDLFCIACNVLHYYADRIAALNTRARFISIVDSARDHLKKQEVRQAALLSISRVMALDEWSPYAPLADHVTLETPADTAALDDIIRSIKRDGAQSAEVFVNFSRVLDSLGSQVILLACTELPLVPVAPRDKRLVDVTALLAETMVRESLKDGEPWVQQQMTRS